MLLLNLCVRSIWFLFK